MSLKTRLDARSENNDKFYLKDADGFILAVVTLTGDKGCTLEIETKEGLHIEKNNGWSSKK